MVANNPPFRGGRQETQWITELLHFDVGRAECVRHVGIGPGTRDQAVRCREVGSFALQGGQRRLCVEDFNRVDKARFHQLVDLGFGQAVSHGIEWVGNVHDCPLVANRLGRVEQTKPSGNPIGEEQADEFTPANSDFFTNDDSTRKLINKPLGARHGLVVGDTQHIDAARGDGLCDFVRRCGRIARPHRVTVPVNPKKTVSLGIA